MPYRVFGRQVAKYDAEQLVRAIAVEATAEAAAQARGDEVTPPVLSFSLAGVARAALAGSRDNGPKARRRRGRVAGAAQIRRLCNDYFAVRDPDMSEPGVADLATFLTRTAFEQFGGQVSPMANLSRAYSLFVEYASDVSEMPSADEWEDALGAPLDVFLRTGFALYVAMMSNDGVVTLDLLGTEQVRPIWEPLEPAEVARVVNDLFAKSFRDHAAACRASEVPGREKWSYSSLVGSPLVAVNDEVICPVPQFLLDKITANGLWYIGQQQWRSRFTDALGDVFEAYIGDHLRLIEHAQVLEQVVAFESGNKLSCCDWFVVTDEVVVLVEVKCARPILDYRMGGEKGLADAREKLGTAVNQIEKTAQRILDGHPSFAHVPSDRPLRGLVVTLEPFYLRQSMREDLVSSDLLPVAVASSHELETSVAALMKREDAGPRLLAALTPNDTELTPRGRAMPVLTDVCSDLKGEVRNPIVDRNWDAWSSWSASADRRKEPR